MEKKYRVLMVGPDRSVHGGISGVVNNYYEAGLDQKISLCYIGTMVEGSKFKKLLQAAVAFVRYSRAIDDYDIVHINMASDNSYRRKAFFIKYAKKKGKKIVIHQHGGDFETFYNKEQDDKGREKIRKILNMADVFLVLAPNWAEFFGNIIPHDKIIVFPDSISIIESYEKQYGQHKLLFLGRICKEKGIRELFQAVKTLKKEFPNLILQLGGIWEDASLEDEAKNLGETVSYLGWLTGEEKQKVLRESDIFVLPSYFEGQSVAILEAMTHYCGVIASDTGGIPQMITTEKNGILVAVKDATALEDAIRRLLSDKELCEKMGHAARVTVESTYSIEENMERLLKIYERLFLY